MEGKESKKSSAGEVNKEMIARDENAWLADNPLSPSLEACMAKITKHANGPTMPGTKATYVNEI
jgi:hypothetical protein